MNFRTTRNNHELQIPPGLEVQVHADNAPNGPLFQDFSQIFTQVFLDAPLHVCNDPFPVDKDIRLDPRAKGLRYLIALVIGDRECYEVVLYEIAYLLFDAEVYPDKFNPASILFIHLLHTGDFIFAVWSPGCPEEQIDRLFPLDVLVIGNFLPLNGNDTDVGCLVPDPQCIRACGKKEQR